MLLVNKLQKIMIEHEKLAQLFKKNINKTENNFLFVTPYK